MAEKSSSQPFYVFPDETGTENLIFGSQADFQKWVEIQSGKWVRVLEFPSEKVPKSLRRYFDANRNLLRRFLNAAYALASNPTDEARAQLQSAYSQAVVQNGIPLLKPEYESFLSNIENVASESAAMSAFASNGTLRAEGVASTIDFANPDVRLGVIAAEMFRLGVNSLVQDASSDRLRYLTNQYETAIAQLHSSFDDFEKNYRSVLSDLRTKSELARQQDRAETDQAVAEFEVSGASALESIKSTEAAFTKQMQLQASVNYWGDRAKSQQASGWIYLGCLALFVLVSYRVGQHLAEMYLPILLKVPLNEQPARYGVALTITLLLTTVFFWAARVLVRLFLSSHHLSNDARERVVMIETYLALLKEGKLEESDKALVLTPLFRASSDGIVKDEGAPDTSAASLLARLLDRNK
ncbi:MAG: hypothetical protein KF794_13930 [Xanthobacteraceae bacterium]|nr:hypothetical protein [Xanthobacteraceae bacterium]QYK44838.1 MAG: hypothetical protein KF794_13930 [Xanthobacteraceae bacterium]